MIISDTVLLYLAHFDHLESLKIVTRVSISVDFPVKYEIYRVGVLGELFKNSISTFPRGK